VAQEPPPVQAEPVPATPEPPAVVEEPPPVQAEPVPATPEPPAVVEEPPPGEGTLPESQPPAPQPPPVERRPAPAPVPEAPPEPGPEPPVAEEEPAVTQPTPVVPEPEATLVPSEEPPVAPPPEPEPELAPEPPFFQERRGSETCPDCREEEAAVTVERTVAPGADGTCPGDLEALAERAARSVAPAPGGGPALLAGGDLAAWTSGVAACQLVGVVLPPGARYRGYRYGAQGGSGAGRCFPGDECPVAGAVWPDRPVIRPLDGGATMVYGVFRNASPDRARRAGISVYYVPAE
jgi:hypothetical protein